MIGYKLTDAYGYTRRGQTGETLWTPCEGQIVAPAGEGREPCGPGVLHFYTSPLEASLYDPIHGNFGPGALMIEIEVDPEAVGDDGAKMWTWEPVTVSVQDPRRPPEIDAEVRAAWAICMAPHESTRQWAISWLSGDDRSRKGAARAETRAALMARAGARAARVARPAWTAETAEWARLEGASRADILAAYERAQKILSGELPPEEYAG